MTKFFIFDCDETLWVSKTHDYLSSIESDLVVSGRVITRTADGAKFILRKGIPEAFEYLSAAGNTIGIASDNQLQMVGRALELFGLNRFVPSAAINVQLWDGHCPKHLMIEEILQRPAFKATKRSDVFWFDDKNYTKKSVEIGVHFVLVTQGFDLPGYIRSVT